MIDETTRQLLADFDIAAQSWGWERDQGSFESARVSEKWYVTARKALAEHLSKPREESVRITSDGAAAVDPDYYWREIGEDTPRGVKLQLLTDTGIALYGHWQPYDRDIVGWAPLPKKRKKA